MESETGEIIISDVQILNSVLDGFYKIADLDLSPEKSIQRVREWIRIAIFLAKGMTNQELRARLAAIVINYQDVCKIFEKER